MSPSVESERVVNRHPHTLYTVVLIIALANWSRGSFGSRLPGSTISDSAFTSGKVATFLMSDQSIFRSGIVKSIGWPEGVHYDGIYRLSPLAAMLWKFAVLFAGPIDGVFLYSLFMTTTSVSFLTKLMRSAAVPEPYIFVGALSVGLSGPMLHWFREVPEYCAIWIPYCGIYAGYRLVNSSGSSIERIRWSLILVITLFFTPYYSLWVIVGTMISLIFVTGLSKTTVMNLAIFFSCVSMIVVYFVGMGQTIGFKREFSDSFSRGISASTFSQDHFMAVSPAVLIVMILVISGFILKRRIIKASASNVQLDHLRVSISIMLGAFFFVSPQIALGKITVPTPGSIIPSLAPVFRHGVYYAHLLHFSILVSAGVICSILLRDVRGRFIFSFKNLTAAIAVGGLLVFACVTNVKLNDSVEVRWMTAVDPSPVIHHLSNLPYGAVAHLPYEIEIGYTATPCLMQYWHHKPLVNVCDYSAPTTLFLDELRRKYRCGKVQLMSSRDVRYVLVDTDGVNPEMLDCLNNKKFGYQLRSTDDVRMLYAR